MSFHYEIRLSGEGGQGLVLAGKVLTEAAAIYEDMNATQSQSYGPEARGGASRSEVIVSDSEIDYPEVTEADILLCMSQQACDKYYAATKRNGLLIVDSTHVKRTPTMRAIKADFSGWAIESTEREITASVVALGFLVGLTDLFPREALEAAVLARTPKGTGEMNLKAAARGFAEAEAFKQT